MSSAASPFSRSRSSEPFLRRMTQLVNRLETLTNSDDGGILLSQRNSNSSQNSPNTSSAAASAARSSRSRRNSSSTHHGDDAQTIQNSNGGLNLRRVHGRLVVPPEEIDAVPHALPTENFYDRFPAAVGPLANVVISSPSELEVLVKMCDRVELVKSPKYRDVALNRLCVEDVHAGGFFVYQVKGQQPQYFKLRATAPEVEYGSASYIQM